MRLRTPSGHIKKDAVQKKMRLPKLELFKVAECQKMRTVACAFSPCPPTMLPHGIFDRSTMLPHGIFDRRCCGKGPSNVAQNLGDFVRGLKPVCFIVFFKKKVGHDHSYHMGNRPGRFAPFHLHDFHDFHRPWLLLCAFWVHPPCWSSIHPARRFATMSMCILYDLLPSYSAMYLNVCIMVDLGAMHEIWLHLIDGQCSSRVSFW